MQHDQHYLDWLKLIGFNWVFMADGSSETMTDMELLEAFHTRPNDIIGYWRLTERGQIFCHSPDDVAIEVVDGVVTIKN